MGRSLDMDNPTEEQRFCVELLEKAHKENQALRDENKFLRHEVQQRVNERDNARELVEKYKQAGAAQLHYDMKAILTGTPEHRAQEALRVAEAVRDDARAHSQHLLEESRLRKEQVALLEEQNKLLRDKVALLEQQTKLLEAKIEHLETTRFELGNGPC